MSLFLLFLLANGPRMPHPGFSASSFEITAAPGLPPIPCVPDSRTICGVKVLRAHDGDTIFINILEPGPLVFTQNIGVRFLGIDAPELLSKRKCERAKAALARDLVKGIMAKAKVVDLHLVGRDKYFRLLAEVTADGQSVGQQVLDAHLAVPYYGGHKQIINWCGNTPIIK